MIRREEVYKIGRIGKPHGVKGELSVHIEDDVFYRVDADYLVFDIEGILVPFFMEEYRFRSDSLVLISFAGIDNVEKAREYVGCDVYFPRSLAELDDELSWSQIVGYTIIDTATKQPIGTVGHVDDSTINTLFEVITTDGREILIPASAELIKDIIEKDRQIVMVIPEGLMELDGVNRS